MNSLRASLDDQILNEYTTEFQLFKLIENPFHYLWIRHRDNWKSNTGKRVIDSTPCEGNTIIKITIITNQSLSTNILSTDILIRMLILRSIINNNISTKRNLPLILFPPIFSHSRKHESHILLLANYFQPSLTACFKFHRISRRIITSNAESYFISPARITDFIHHALLHFRCFTAGGREKIISRVRTASYDFPNFNKSWPRFVLFTRLINSAWKVMISFQEEKEEEEKEKEKDHCSFFLSSIMEHSREIFSSVNIFIIETFTFEIISKDFKRYYYKATTIGES